MEHQNFPAIVQQAALGRQKHLCASCGCRIHDIGEHRKIDHHFGERAEAHHIIPHSIGGPLTVENCVVICRACHLNVHQGGRWSDNSIYGDLAKLSLNEKIRRMASHYPYYKG